ncbi:MAG: hypothetical protein ACXV8G_15650 [Acidimicrobiales bacterium]
MITASMSAAAVERVSAKFGLQPRERVDLLPIDTGEPVGEGVVLVGLDLDKAVVADLEFGDGQQPSCAQLFYAFSRPNSLTPHLAVEWSVHDDEVAMHVDLLPRVDLSVNSDYVDEVYTALNSALDEVRSLPDLVPDPLPPRRAVGFSPWLVAVRGPASLASALANTVDQYIDHWFALFSGGVSVSVDPISTDPSRLVQRDRFHRVALFPDDDPQWARITRRCGLDRAAELRSFFRTQESR